MKSRFNLVNVSVHQAMLLAIASFLVLGAEIASAKTCNNNLDCLPPTTICGPAKQCIPNPTYNPNPPTTTTGPKPPTPTGVSVIIGGISCVTGFSGCGKPVDTATITGILKDAAKACVKVKDPTDPPGTVQALFDKCVKDGVTAALTKIYGTAGACFPIVGQILNCTSAAANALGYGFNKLWCDTYPDTCEGQMHRSQMAGAKYSSCVNATPRPSNAQCYSCCMEGSGFLNCNGGLGPNAKNRCKSWEKTCLKCNLR